MSSAFKLAILHSLGKMTDVRILQKAYMLAALLLIFCSEVFAAELITPESHVERYLKADLVIIGEILSCTTKVVEKKDVPEDSGWVNHYTTTFTLATVRVDSVLKGSSGDSGIVIQKETSQESRSRFDKVNQNGDSLYLMEMWSSNGDDFIVKIPCSGNWIIFVTEGDDSYWYLWSTEYSRIALVIYKACDEEGEKIYEKYDLNSFEAVETDSGWEYRLRKKPPPE